MLEDVGITGNKNVGALVGANYGNINTSYSSGEVEGTDDNTGGLVGYNAGFIENWAIESNVTGKDRTGGFIVFNPGGTIEASFSTGDVLGVNRAGGLTGGNTESGSVVNSYSFSSVTAAGDGSGLYIAGLVGMNNSGKVETSYSTGLVTGTAISARGLISQNQGEGTSERSYWDTEASGKTTSVGGEGKTTAQMKQEATYGDWDFADVWLINGDYLDLIDNPR